MMNISCIIFDQITTLDAIGPLTVLARIPDVEINFVGLEKGEVRSVQSKLGLSVDYDLDSTPESEILIVPGGPGIRVLLKNKFVLNWLSDRYKTTRWTASVCTGSLLLGAAGLLVGKKATTHWNAMKDLGSYGAIPVSERVVIDEKIITGAGVSAGIDMALQLTKMIVGEKIARAIQLKIEYDPLPPFDGGSPSKESQEIITLSKNIKFKA